MYEEADLLDGLFGYQDNIVNTICDESLTTEQFIKTLASRVANSFFDIEPLSEQTNITIADIISNLWRCESNFSFLSNQYQAIPKQILHRLSDVFVASVVILAQEKKHLFSDPSMRKNLAAALSGDVSVSKAFFKTKKIKEEIFNNRLNIIKSFINEEKLKDLDLGQVQRFAKLQTYEILSKLMFDLLDNNNSIFEKWLIKQRTVLLNRIEPQNIQSLDIESGSTETSETAQLIKRFNAWHLSNSSIKDYIINQRSSLEPFKMIFDKMKTLIICYQGEDVMQETLLEFHNLLGTKSFFDCSDLSHIEFIIKNLRIEKTQIKEFLTMQFQQCTLLQKITWLACLVKERFPQESISNLSTVLSELFNNKFDFSTLPELNIFQNWHPLVRTAFCVLQNQDLTLNAGLLEFCLYPKLYPGTIFYRKTKIFKTLDKNSASYYEQLAVIIRKSPYSKIDSVIREFDKLHIASSPDVDEMHIESIKPLSDSDRYYCLALMISFGSDGYNDPTIDEWIAQEMKEMWEHIRVTPEDKSAIRLTYCLTAILATKTTLMHKMIQKPDNIKLN